jgi:hypothetical protein
MWDRVVVDAGIDLSVLNVCDGLAMRVMPGLYARCVLRHCGGAVAGMFQRRVIRHSTLPLGL